MPEIVLRPMRAADLPAVLAIQAQCYGDALVESAHALESRLLLSPDFCWVAALADRSLAGYLLTHAWPEASLPPWNGHLTSDWDEDAALTWFVHDMAVAPAGQGTGVAGRLYDAARNRATASGLTTSRLIAVQSAGDYWRRLGYVQAQAAGFSEKLAMYGAGALLMERRL